jgi:hypothetical protein
MGRAFDKVTPAELKLHVEGILLGEHGTVDWYRLWPATGEKKVQFDTENYDLQPIPGLRGNDALDAFLGIHTLSNGLTFWGMQAGGDWEYWVCFIVYLSKGRLRLYVPKDGNLWNTSTKKAYGNDESLDTWNAYKRFSSQLEPMNREEMAETDVHDLALDYDQDEMIADILLRFS